MESIKLTNTIKAVNELATGIIFSIKKAMPSDTEKLRRSVNYKLKQKNENFIITIKYLKYGDYVETGTKPHYVPIAALKKWAKRKGLNPWAVQKSIGIKGTKPQPWKYSIDEAIKASIDKVIKAYATDVKKYIKERFKF